MLFIMNVVISLYMLSSFYSVSIFLAVDNIITAMTLFASLMILALVETSNKPLDQTELHIYIKDKKYTQLVYLYYYNIISVRSE